MAPAPAPKIIDVPKALNDAKELLTKGSSGVIVIPPNAVPDSIAAATSLYLALLKMGKTVTLVCSEKPQSDLIAADKFQTSFTAGGNNLVISFPYTEGSIDDVTYDVDQENFYIIITPRQGKKKVEPNEVKFRYTGGKLDFIVTIDAQSPQTLGDVFRRSPNTFSGKNLINIDRHMMNTVYGSINLLVRNVASTSEIIYHVVRALGVAVDPDIATNLYTGIASATNNFAVMTLGADTFELAARLMRAGAVRRQMASGRPVQSVPQMPVAQMPPQMMPGMQQGVNPYAAQMAAMNPAMNPYGARVPGMPQVPGAYPQMPMMPQAQAPQPYATPVPLSAQTPVVPVAEGIGNAQSNGPTFQQSKVDIKRVIQDTDSSEVDGDANPSEDRPRSDASVKQPIETTPMSQVERKPAQQNTDSKDESNPDSILKPKFSQNSGLV